MEKGRREGMRGKNYDERNARGTGVGGGGPGNAHCRPVHTPWHEALGQVDAVADASHVRYGVPGTGGGG